MSFDRVVKVEFPLLSLWKPTSSPSLLSLFLVSNTSSYQKILLDWIIKIERDVQDDWELRFKIEESRSGIRRGNKVLDPTIPVVLRKIPQIISLRSRLSSLHAV